MAGQIWVLSGAPGAGKTAVVAQLVEQLTDPSAAAPGGGVVVADMDELLSDGSLLGLPIASAAGAAHWPAYNALWARIVTLVCRSGISMLVLTPLLPAEWGTALGTQLPDVGTGRTVGAAGAVGARWLLLDCSDAERSRRLRARGWDRVRIDDALADATVGRLELPDRVDSSEDDPAAVARSICRWLLEPLVP